MKQRQISAAHFSVDSTNDRFAKFTDSQRSHYLAINKNYMQENMTKKWV